MRKLTLFILSFLSASALADMQPQAMSEDRAIKITEQAAQRYTTDTTVWGVTKEEYTKYESLMKSSPASKWYKQLDPAEVLGMMTENEVERMKYARIVARLHKERVDRELSFQIAFNKAFEEMYPGLKPIATDAKIASPSHTIFQPGDQLLAFVPISMESSDFVQALLTKQSENPLVFLHFYLLGSKQDSDIQGWARKYRIPVTQVKSGQITLNHDEGRFSQMAGQSAKAPLALHSRRGLIKPIEVK